MNKVISRGVLLSSLFFSLGTAHAAPVFCPPAEAFLQFKHEGSVPYGYDAKAKSMKMVSIATPKRSRYYDENDYDIESILVIHPMLVAKDIKPKEAFSELIQQLELASDEAFQYSYDRDFKVGVCPYTVPGNENLNAMLYINLDEYQQDFNAKIMQTVLQPKQIP